MIERVHEHIISELQQNIRNDTIFIITAILLNLVTLGINSGVAGESRDSVTWTIVMGMFVALIIVVNFVVIVGLVKGKQTRMKLNKASSRCTGTRRLLVTMTSPC